MKALDNFHTLTASFLSGRSAWTICWLLLMVTWLSCVAKSDSHSLSVICSQTFQNILQLIKYSPLHLLGSNGIIHSWEKILPQYWIYQLLYCLLQPNYHLIKDHLEPILCNFFNSAHLSVTSLWASNNFPCKNFNFDLLLCSLMSLFI